MEVQKHPHHVMHKKHWPEYLLEFFMLFLAVFLGFVAENVREHSEEKHRAREYVESFYEDLKGDTDRITWNIDFDQEKVDGLQDIGDCYDSVSRNPKEGSCLMDIFRVTAINRPFIWTERTFKQLGNAGGFRLLNKEDADSILSYEEKYEILQDIQATVYQDVQNNVRSTLNTIGNFKALDKPDGSAPLLFSTDKALLNKYFNELQLYYRVVSNHRVMLMHLKEQQTQLLWYFKTKYGYE